VTGEADLPVRLPSPVLPPSARPLSDEIARLLRDGDTDARYASRSEAVMATALAAASAGWTEVAWREMLANSALAGWATTQHRKGGACRARNPADADRRLATTWAKAARRAVLRPPATDHLAVRAELAAVLAVADADPAQWGGAAGVTDHAVLAVLVETGMHACTLTPSASTRQIAEAANVSSTTAANALHRLVDRGWIARHAAAQGTSAAAWRLLRPDTSAETPADVDELLEALPPRPVLEVSARAADAFANSIHGGLGRVAARIFDALDDGVAGGLSVAQLAVLTGLHRRTVGRHLIGLQATGLACGRIGGRWARSLTAGHPETRHAALEAAAGLLGCAGAGPRRRERHRRQREGFVAWWTDFAARRGWRVQRGLYRPDQPELPLPLAA